MITAEALRDNFGYQGSITQETLVEAFLAHRAMIEGIAEHLIRQERFEQDGSVLIYSSACKAYLEGLS
jgi:hypothetical protein